MDRLKSCPFCGCPMNLMADGTLFAWHSSDCFFQLLEEYEVDMTLDQIKVEFVKAWNRRSNNG